MAERIERVLTERSALSVSRVTVEGERRRLMDAGLEPHHVVLARALEPDGGHRSASPRYHGRSFPRSGILRHAIAQALLPFLHPSVRNPWCPSCRLRRGTILDRDERPRLRDRNRDAGRFPPRVCVGIGYRSLRYRGARPRLGECEAL